MEKHKDPTEVEMSQLVMPSHTNPLSKTMSVGQLLKWLDTAACLSAEKHAGEPCVTVAMDDVYFKRPILEGQLVSIKAQVTRAFNTSMEVGVHVHVEELRMQEKYHVCEAFFTFVSHGEVGKKRAKLLPIVPYTTEEKLQYSLAKERRRMRIERPGSVKKLSRRLSVIDSAERRSFVDGRVSVDTPVVYPSSTIVQSTEIVLPPHANHHQSTFGGQIMAWMHTACTISATKFCRADPTLKAVDELKFLGPSKVGDRIVIRSMVNNVTDRSIEVGCRVEAYAIGEEIRHINSAFLTYVIPESAKKIPLLVGNTEEEKRRIAESLARRRLRMDRKAIRNNIGPVISIPWTQENSQLLNYNNILALNELYMMTEWDHVEICTGISLSKKQMGQYLCVKVDVEADVSPETAFRLLSDTKQRPKWDTLVLHSTVIQEVDEGDDIVKFILPDADDRSKLCDFIVLASTRVPSDERDHFTIAYKSVILDSHPPLPEYKRREILCSGMLIKAKAGDNATCVITYINQTTAQVLAYVSQDLAGVTREYAGRVKSMLQYLKENSPDTSVDTVF